MIGLSERCSPSTRPPNARSPSVVCHGVGFFPRTVTRTVTPRTRTMPAGLASGLNGRGTDLAGAFLSYRLAAESEVAAGITQQLARRFGPDSFFRDVDTMTPGPFYTRAIMRALVNSDVLVAVLGPDWRTVTGSEGRRRLDDPTDWLRLEVGWAAEFDIPIVLVLLDGAEQPT